MDTSELPARGTPTDAEYRDLLAFRVEMRRFMRWSEERALENGLTHVQHQLLLAVRGHPDLRGPTMSDLSDYLLQRPSSTAELVDRAEATGHVRRHRTDTDARVVRLLLTELGDNVLARLTDLVLGELGRIGPTLNKVILDASRRT